MKKTMFITSVIMVIVMAIALTTSSLAWFSASGANSVTTNALKVTATSEATSGIEISSELGEHVFWTRVIDLHSAGSTGLNPLVPYTKTAITGSTESATLVTLMTEALVGGYEKPFLSEEAFADEVTKYNADRYSTLYMTAFDRYIAETEATEVTSLSRDAMITAGYLAATALEAEASRSAYMIGNKVDSNGAFINVVNHDGYYVDTMYLRNTAEGYGALQAGITVDLTYTFRAWTQNAQSQWVLGEEQLYTQRDPAKQALDPILCVAVLAQTNFKVDDAQYYKAYTAKETATANKTEALSANAQADVTAYDATIAECDAIMAGKKEYKVVNTELTDAVQVKVAKWEIIGYFQSKDNATINNNVNYKCETPKLGKNATAFANGSMASDSYVRKALGSYALNKQSTTSMQGKHALNDIEKEGDIMPIKVVAWYDGTSLISSNASSDPNAVGGAADLEFKLTFNKVDIPNP